MLCVYVPGGSLVFWKMSTFCKSQICSTLAKTILLIVSHTYVIIIALRSHIRAHIIIFVLFNFYLAVTQSVSIGSHFYYEKYSLFGVKYH